MILCRTLAIATKDRNRDTAARRLGHKGAMARYLSIGLCLALLVPDTFAGGPQQLHIQKQIPVTNINIGYITDTVKCGGTGDLFLMLPARGTNGGPILRISPDGQETVTFAINSVPDLIDGKINDFAPSATGDGLFLLVKSGSGEQYVVRFDGDGRYKSRSRIALSIDGRRIADFSDQEFLISGTEAKTGTTQRQAFIGLFGSDGQLLRRIESPDDVLPVAGQSQVRTKPGTGAGEAIQDIDTGRRDKTYEKALNLSIAQAGPDGSLPPPTRPFSSALRNLRRRRG